MDEATARWLVSPDAAEALGLAGAEPDPASLAAAERLRRIVAPDRAAAVLAQAGLRRRARTKFGAAADGLFFTADGLEQATRPAVAAWRAARFVAAGVTRVADFGCGLGTDARAFADAGMDVVAVEADPVTAVLAAANLGSRASVVAGDAVAAWPGLAGEVDGVFCDPARRTARGRSWRIEDFTPSWAFVAGLLDGSRPACVKLGPGVPDALLPDQVAAVWVSERGDLVEASLWAGGPWAAGERSAVVLPSGARIIASRGRTLLEPVARVQPGMVLYEPDPAVIRAGAVPELARRLGAAPVSSGIAYLVGPGPMADQGPPGPANRTSPDPAGADQPPAPAAKEGGQVAEPAGPTSPFATAFEILEVLDAGERALRRWVRDNQVGTLEIKKRGIEVDPAELRRRLRPSGPNAATLVLTPTRTGAKALVVRRRG